MMTDEKMAKHETCRVSYPIHPSQRRDASKKFQPAGQAEYCCVTTCWERWQTLLLCTLKRWV